MYCRRDLAELTWALLGELSGRGVEAPSTLQPPPIGAGAGALLDEAEYLDDRSRGLTSEELLQNHILRRAFARSLEIIGEAAKQVPEETPARALRPGVARYGRNA